MSKKNTVRYLVSPFKLAVAAATSAVCAVMACVSVSIREPAGAVVFSVIALLFLAVAASSGSVITLDASGIRKSLLSIPLSQAGWEEIAEVGVIGTRVLGGGDKKRTGTRYLYFSPSPLDGPGRFQLALKWPPRNLLYLQYTKERLESVQLLWEKEIETYNAGDVFF